jgi:hypothetical protein
MTKQIRVHFSNFHNLDLVRTTRIEKNVTIIINCELVDVTGKAFVTSFLKVLGLIREREEGDISKFSRSSPSQSR